MLKTFFGCCSLQRGVSCIAIFNILWNICGIIKHILHRQAQYGKTYANKFLHESNSSEENTAYPDYASDIEIIPVMNGIFMDYVFICCISWIVLELIANVNLKQATFKHAPHKIYVWLTVNYGNLIFMITHMGYYELEFIKHNTIKHLNDIDIHQSFGILDWKLAYIVIILVEIIIVYSYYVAEEKAVLNNFVQIKWKYVSKGEVVSKGVDYPTTSNFTALISRQNQEGSRMPPYITNILQE